MKHIAMGCALALGLTMSAFASVPANAIGGGVNGSYARAYCYYYKTKIAAAARRQSRQVLAADHAARRDDRRSPEYWRQAYRECIKEHGY